ncbi:unnamed protein product [Cylicocyclus nassatus]|uniref:Tudor domain-containing protein n=1 Tax=Cylicocyclus nassatus TaxID=53992 RepID=A0AA36M7Z9_CYLNA|nr:unnamed protein product [Cylicocyclus nassatus]
MFIGNEPRERPLSPIFTDADKPQMRRNGLQEDGMLKVNRIPLIRTAIVEVLRAESPSCIWVRLTNHITDTLVFTEPYDLVQRYKKGGPDGDKEISEFEYCLAPFADRKYARCRVLDVVDNMVKVIFIDEGITAWMFRDCLACMPVELSYHPWQAIKVSLCGVGMRELLRRKQGTLIWHDEECAIFRQILTRFPLMKTRTVKSSIVHNDYRKAVQVELYGIPEGHNNTSSEVGVSIAALFSAELRGHLRARRVANSADFTPALNIDGEALPLREKEIPLFRREFPKDWKRVSVANDQATINEKIREWQDWTPDKAHIPPLEVEWLNANGYRTAYNDEYLVNIEGSQTQSPYEFYARPIRRERVEVTGKDLIGELGEVEAQLQSETDAMLNAHDELRKKATVLDAFYSLEDNRSPLDSSDCIKWLKSNMRVFAICACSEERGTYTGEWQRVEVLSCDGFANVLFLDSGGTELVVPYSLYKIHPTHCTYPPMCMQLCMHGVGPREADKKLEWSEGAKNEWRKLLREDLPMSISVIERLNRENDDKVLPISEPAWKRPGVLFIKFLRVHGDNETTLKKFCSPSRSPNNGLPQKDVPRSWPEFSSH